MKKSKQQQRDENKDINASLELLFGSEAELAKDDLEAEINEFGVEAAILDQKAYERFKESAHHHFVSLEKKVPAAMSAALRQLKPPTEQQQRAQLTESATSRIKGILSAVQSKTSSVMGSVAGVPQQSPAYAFRNKGDLTKRDLELLEDAQRELNQKTDRNGNQNE
jgi:hypothetical protein